MFAKIAVLQEVNSQKTAEVFPQLLRVEEMPEVSVVLNNYVLPS